MYSPAQFQENRPDVLARAIRDIQLATLVTAHGRDDAASHVPMVLKVDRDTMVLESHVARSNDHWAVLDEPRPSLAVFSGPQTYVSPSWYETKRQHGKVVPTWNDVSVHARGRLEVLSDPA